MNSSKVLVVMSGAHLLELKDNKVYATGYYLNELATPLRALVKAGYTPVFASPNGNAPTMDATKLLQAPKRLRRPWRPSPRGRIPAWPAALRNFSPNSPIF
jgi:putative intracellular protease/amidase